MTEFEKLLLQVIAKLGDDAYGYTIWQEILKVRGVSLGSIYVWLDRMEENRLLLSWTGDPTPERGWRAKRFYKLTDTGRALLKP